jgi:hypothetical protein
MSKGVMRIGYSESTNSPNKTENAGLIILSVSLFPY